MDNAELVNEVVLEFPQIYMPTDITFILEGYYIPVKPKEPQSPKYPVKQTDSLLHFLQLIVVVGGFLSFTFIAVGIFKDDDSATFGLQYGLIGSVVTFILFLLYKNVDSDYERKHDQSIANYNIENKEYLILIQNR